MAYLGYPQDAINLIGNIYSNSSTRFLGTHFGQTKLVHIQRGTIKGDTLSPYLFIILVHIQRGTIKGDTLSPYLFIIFLELLLRWLERGNLG
jgi:hypothetical protein